MYKIVTPIANLDAHRRSFAVRVVPLWNSLGNDTVSAQSLNNFKVLLQRDLGDSLYNFVEYFNNALN